MINTIQMKAFELFYRVSEALNFEGHIAALQARKDALNDESGQTATEYVAMSAVALMLAILIVWVAFKGALNGAVSTIGSRLTDFVTNTTS